MSLAAGGSNKCERSEHPKTARQLQRIVRCQPVQGRADIGRNTLGLAKRRGPLSLALSIYAPPVAGRQGLSVTSVHFVTLAGGIRTLEWQQPEGGGAASRSLRACLFPARPAELPPPAGDLAGVSWINLSGRHSECCAATSFCLVMPIRRTRLKSESTSSLLLPAAHLTRQLSCGRLQPLRA